MGISTSIIKTTEGSAISERVAPLVALTTTFPALATKPTAIGTITPITIKATAIRITLFMSFAKIYQLFRNEKYEIFLVKVK